MDINVFCELSCLCVVMIIGFMVVCECNFKLGIFNFYWMNIERWIILMWSSDVLNCIYCYLIYFILELDLIYLCFYKVECVGLIFISGLLVGDS